MSDANSQRVWAGEAGVPRGRWLARAGAAIALAGAMWLTRRAYKHLSYPEAEPFWWVLWLLLAVVGASVWLAGRFGRKGDATRSAAFAVAYLAAFILTRLTWLSLVPTLPHSDFGTYMKFAQLVADGAPLDPKDTYFFAWGYPLLLSPVLRAFGGGLVTAQLFNILLQIATLPAIAYLGRVIGGGRGAAIFLWLYLIWPAALFMTSVPASEAPAALLGAWAMAGTVACVRRGPHWIMALAVGVMLGGAYAVRPVLGILAPCVLLVWAMYGRSWRLAVRDGAVCAVAFGAWVGLYNYGLRSAFGRTPPSVATWNLLVGQNEESVGRWNEADLQFFWYRESLEASEAAGREEIARRLSRPWHRTLRLAWRKQEMLWADMYYGVYWATGKMRTETEAEGVRVLLLRDLSRTVNTVGQTIQIAMFAMAAVGLWKFAMRPRSAALAISLWLILAGSLAHAIFETQNRYQHVFMLGIMAFATAAWIELGRLDRTPHATRPA